MDKFEFVLSLFGLLLGLALAEGLGGLARALKASHKVRIGWPTAMLGLFVSCDVVTFWMYGWALRDHIPVNWPTVFTGFVVTALYYISASLIFPDDPEEWRDLDGHFDKQRRKVLAGVLACNTILLGATVMLLGAGGFLNLRSFVITWSFFPVTALAIAARRRGVVLACLGWLIPLYPLSAVWNG